jgi:parallel beta-helix repeat protein
MTAIRDKLGWAVATAVSLLLVATLAGVVRGGPLDPPGPVGPTGKTVITSLPFPITQPGSYVLNGNLSCTGPCAGGSAITVNSSDVTIDMQGFVLTGTLTQPGYAIETSASRLTIRNGIITDWYGGGGILAGTYLHVDGLTLNLAGIRAGDNATITNCSVAFANDTGIHVGHRSIINKCQVHNSTGDGVSAGDNSVITETITFFNGDGSAAEILTGNGATLENCVADGNYGAGNGIQVGSGSVIRGCTARDNGGVGILTGLNVTLENCVSHDNSGVGIQLDSDSILRGCTARSNDGTEIYAGNQVIIEDCVAEGQGVSARTAGDGVRVGTKSTVRGCIVTNNGGNGIITDGTNDRLEDNEVLDNTGWGIYLFTGAGHVVIGNRSQANGGNCWDPGNNAFIKETGGTFGSATHPWTNLC